MSGRSYQVVVIGRGLIGSAAARHLSAAEDGVAVVGPDEPAERASHTGPFGSHFDEGRITRVLDADPVWARLADASLGRYRALEESSGIPFYAEHSYLNVSVPRGARYLDRVADVGRALRVDFQALDSDGLRSRFPAFVFPPGATGLLQTGRAGHVNPRALRAAQETVARSQGATISRDEVTRVRSAPGRITVETRSGAELLADRVIVAVGGYANAPGLLPRRLPLDLQGRTVVFARVAGPTLEALRDAPSLVVLLEREGEIVDVYLLRPIRYPDGEHWLKIGTGAIPHPLHTQEEIAAWFRHAGPDGDRIALERVLGELLPDLVGADLRTETCLYTETPSGYPYIDWIADERIAVATGGNGKAAKSSDEIGRLAAALVRGRWDDDYDRAVFRAGAT